MLFRADYDAVHAPVAFVQTVVIALLINTGVGLTCVSSQALVCTTPVGIVAITRNRPPSQGPDIREVVLFSESVTGDVYNAGNTKCSLHIGKVGKPRQQWGRFILGNLARGGVGLF